MIEVGPVDKKLSWRKGGKGEKGSWSAEGFESESQGQRGD